MSKQLALSSALSVVMMAALALFATTSESRSNYPSAGKTLIETQALIR